MRLSEWEEIHKNDPEWIATQKKLKAEERKRQTAEAVLLENEAPLVQELRVAGYDVQSAWDLFNRKQPWRKDVPILPYQAAIPILVNHLQGAYHFRVREGVVRALTTRDARAAFDHLVDEYRRTANSFTQDQTRAVDMLQAGVGGLWSRDELERVTAAQWDQYRFALANAIGFHLDSDRVPIVLELIRDQRHGDSRARLIEFVRQKARRWKRANNEIVHVLKNLAHESGLVGLEARKAFRVLKL